MCSFVVKWSGIFVEARKKTEFKIGFSFYLRIFVSLVLLSSIFSHWVCFLSIYCFLLIICFARLLQLDRYFMSRFHPRQPRFTLPHPMSTFPCYLFFIIIMLQLFESPFHLSVLTVSLAWFFSPCIPSFICWMQAFLFTLSFHSILLLSFCIFSIFLLFPLILRPLFPAFFFSLLYIFTSPTPVSFPGPTGDRDCPHRGWPGNQRKVISHPAEDEDELLEGV